jgi:UDPglucose 6-dehydrogenase
MAACFADFGNRVTCVDVIPEKLENLKKGIMPIYEPGLDDIVVRNVNAGRLLFTTSYDAALNDAKYPAEFVFIAVGTPEGVDGAADLRYVRSVAESIAQTMDHPLIIINKSTVPVGTGDWVGNIVRGKQPKPIPYSVVSNPEFLREGMAVSDFLNPDRVVLGSVDKQAAARVGELYGSLRAPIQIVDLPTAEMIKYASNAFLATKISFINEMANICEQLGADVKDVAIGMGYDKRIGRAFLDAGLGYGGSCFPKDVKALAYMAQTQGKHPQLLEAVMQINADMRRSVVSKAIALINGASNGKFNRLEGKNIGVLGIAFKPNTDDIREAAAIDIIRMLQTEGAKIKAYDPVAMENAGRVLRDVKLCEDAYETATDCDVLVIATEWNEFKQLDFKRIKSLMRQPKIVDGRNIYDASVLRELGFASRGVGRGYE